MTGYAKCFDSKKMMSFKAIDNELLKKCSKIHKNIGNLMDIKFDSEFIYGDKDKQIETKIITYENKFNTNFQVKKISKKKCIINIFINRNARFCY